VETIHQCPLCKSNNFNTYCIKIDSYTGIQFTILRCNSCGLGFVNPRPDSSEIIKHYPPYYSWKKSKNKNLVNRLEQWYRYHLIKYEITKILKKLKLSRRNTPDIGCGTGDRLDIFEKNGLTPFGIEPTDSIDEMLKKRKNNY